MTNPLRISLLAAAIALAGCAAPTPVPLYTLQADHPNSAEVEVWLPYSGRNYSEGLVLRGAAKCNPSTLFSFGIKVIEEPGRPIAYSRHEAYVHTSRLPAGEPLALQFWKTRVTETFRWNMVVVLAPGARYRAFINDLTPSIVDKDTGLEALRLPHDYLQRQLHCP